MHQWKVKKPYVYFLSTSNGWVQLIDAHNGLLWSNEEIVRKSFIYKDYKLLDIEGKKLTKAGKIIIKTNTNSCNKIKGITPL